MTAELKATRACVRMPASLPLRSRSKPSATPQTVAEPSRRRMSVNEMAVASSSMNRSGLREVWRGSGSTRPGRCLSPKPFASLSGQSQPETLIGGVEAERCGGIGRKIPVTGRPFNVVSARPTAKSRHTLQWLSCSGTVGAIPMDTPPAQTCRHVGKDQMSIRAPISTARSAGMRK